MSGYRDPEEAGYKNSTRGRLCLSDPKAETTKEVTLGSWRDGEQRLDIRKWKAGKLGKGISLNEEEVRKLRKILEKIPFGALPKPPAPAQPQPTQKPVTQTPKAPPLEVTVHMAQPRPQTPRPSTAQKVLPVLTLLLTVVVIVLSVSLWRTTTQLTEAQSDLKVCEQSHTPIRELRELYNLSRGFWWVNPDSEDESTGLRLGVTGDRLEDYLNELNEKYDFGDGYAYSSARAGK